MWATERAVDVKKEGKARQVAKGKIPVGESQWLTSYLNFSTFLFLLDFKFLIKRILAFLVKKEFVRIEFNFELNWWLK